MHLMGKTRVLAELPSGVSSSAVDHQLPVSESTIYINTMSLIKKTHIKQSYVLID